MTKNTGLKILGVVMVGVPFALAGYFAPAEATALLVGTLLFVAGMALLCWVHCGEE